MAQRTIHYLFGEIIFGQVPLSDKERFLLGSILPDAIDPSSRVTSHFRVDTGQIKYFDFEAFRLRYSRQILQDDLYLGYYMHLVEDAFYRSFFYTPQFFMPVTSADVRMLHQDYHILNAYIVQKYQIQNILDTVFPSDNSPIWDLTTFLINPFLVELSNDVVEQVQGQTTFITESMLDQFVDHFIPLAIAECKSMKHGTSILKPADFAWLTNR